MNIIYIYINLKISIGILENFVSFQFNSLAVDSQN